MSGLVHHLVRRGIEETHQRFQKSPEEGNTFQIPAWGAATLLATVVMYAAVMFGVRIPWWPSSWSSADHDHLD